MAYDGITAVIFDWDFTLAYTLDKNATLSQRLTYLFQTYGVDCTETSFSAAFQKLQDDIRSGKVAGSLFPQRRREIIHKYRLLLRYLGHNDSSHDFAYQLYSGYALLPHTLYADVPFAMKRLRGHGFKLGILSNHSISARPVIEKQISPYIGPENIVVSEELGVHKPRRTAFQRAASRIGARPESCVYVGDNREVDAIGAVMNGGFMMGFWLDRSEKGMSNPLPRCVFRVTSLHQFVKMAVRRPH